MGEAGERSAVTDTEGRVHGAQRLRVVDASLMSRLPSANTNIPTIMIAEKIADTMVMKRCQRGERVTVPTAASPC
jgi:5-(hydroxymethyl)furfural/furfural oxidase